MELFIYLFVCSVKPVLLRCSKSRGNGTIRNKYRSKVREQKVGEGGKHFGSPALCSCFMAALKAFTISLSAPSLPSTPARYFLLLITYFDPARLCPRSLRKCPYFPRTPLRGWPPGGGSALAPPWTSTPGCTWWSRAGAARRSWVGSRRRDGRVAAPA